jgi:hypothetical protein
MAHADRARRSPLLALGLLTTATAACAALVGLPDVPDVPVDAGMDAQGDTDAAGDAKAGCALTAPPPRPGADDPSTDTEQTFVVAMRALDFGIRTDGGPGPSLGYDLDHVATCCLSAPESCVPAAGAAHCDGDGGVDNSGGLLLANLARVAPSFSQDTINQRMATGLYSLLFQVTHYNGTPNDPQVTVGVLPSRGIAPRDGTDAAAPPIWDGTDTWTIDKDFVLGNPNQIPITPGRFDANAYVSNGVLVATIDFPLSLGVTAGNSVVVSLRGGVVTGRVEDAGAGRFRVAEAQLAGRWGSRALLGELPNVFVLGAFVCPGTSTYAQLKDLICKAADVTNDPTHDGVGATCDALSVALGFVAEPALAGRVLAPTPRPVNCRDAGPDDCPP